MSCFHKKQDISDGTTIETTTSGVYLRTRGIKRVKDRRRFSLLGWIRNGGFKYIFAVFWLFVNAAVFADVYYHYKYQPKYYYLREILGKSLCWSRGSAALLNLNCAALLLPVCKHLGATLRGAKMTRRTLRRWLDHYRFTHIMFAGCVCTATVIHCAAHILNAIRFSRGFNNDIPDINVASFPGQNPCTMLLQTVAGLSGLGMLLILLFILLTSMPCFRRIRHNVFWLCHHSFLLFYVLLICHPLGGILKEQCNTDIHTPGCIPPDIPLAEPMPDQAAESGDGYRRIAPFAEPSAMNMKSNSSSVMCSEQPAFESHKSRTWQFLLVPAILYLVERVWRWIKSRRFVFVEMVRFHPDDVIELQLYVRNFSAKPGQFILLNCPSISHLEWHPFTLTSCPSADDTSFKLQVKVCGDWTDSLRQLLKQRPTVTHGDDSYIEYPRFLIDGPLGGASEDVIKYRVSVCIAGGIGVTPFAAMLNNIATMNSEDISRLKLMRLYFVWICREESHFQWLSEEINSLQSKLWQMNKPDFLNLKLYTTGSNNDNKQRSEKSLPTTLCCRILQGRPNFTEILNDVTLCNPKQDIGVFVCGPRKLSSKVHRLCNRLNRNKSHFHFNKENFS